MLNINPLRFYTYKNNTYKNNITPLRLKTLNRDTVSFTSNIKHSQKQVNALARALGGIIANDDQCESVSENAKVAEKELNSTLINSLYPLFYIYGKNEKGIIQTVTTRVKTKESIKEKVMDQLAQVIASDKEKFKAYDTDDIKEIIGDIIGARIILKRADVDKNAQIIDALIDLIEKKKLKITKIENYTIKDNPKLEYFNVDDLERLKDTANKYRAINQPEVQLVTTEKPTGYMAVHIDLDLSNDEFPSKNDDYKGEIQIVGCDVERLKEVEDCCYKLKQGKDLKAGDKAYSALTEFFNTYMDEEKYPNVKENFLLYTRLAYQKQREKEPITTKDAKKQNFTLPTIEECGMQNKIPHQLDFNNLALILKKSDELYRVVKTAKK